jgi:hypothetical protein
MPLYEIHHSVPLLPAQLSTLAKAITNLHCSTFSAPSSFVNIVFHPSTTSETTIGPAIFVGGAQHETNYIIGHLRPRSSKPADQLNILTAELTKIWNQVVRSGDNPLRDTPKSPGTTSNPEPPDHFDLTSERSSSSESMDLHGRLDDPLSLHNIFIMEDIAAGAEQGFILPIAGKDGEWAQENMKKFKARARAGDASMEALVSEHRQGFGKSKL